MLGARTALPASLRLRFCSRSFFSSAAATMLTPDSARGARARIRMLPAETDSEAYRSIVAEAAGLLKAGKVIALPTDTIYGLAAMAQSAPGVRHIYEIKGRDFNKPVAICVADAADVAKYGRVDVPEGLLSKLLPGPVTVAFDRRDHLNKTLNPGAKLVGVRVPDCPFGVCWPLPLRPLSCFLRPRSEA